MAQVNPYNVLAFYAYRPSIITEAAPLVCSPALLSFQLRKTTITTVDAFTIIAEDGTELDMDTSRIETACTADYGYFATYFATSAPAGIADGKYQFKVTLDGTNYYSHPFCVDSRFANIYEQVIDYSVEQTAPDDFVLTLTFDTAIRHGRRKIEIDYGSGYENVTVWVSASQSKATITDASSGTGSISLPVRITHEFEESSIVLLYTLTFDTFDIAGTIVLTLDSSTYNVNNDLYYLVTFRNTNDIVDMGLFYQDGYTQKLFLKGYARAPQVIQESRYQTNAKGTPFFNSQTIAEKTVLDFYPVPDYLQAVLNGLQNHTTVTLYDAQTGQSTSLSQARPVFEFAPVENDVTLKGTFSYETNRAFVACEENMEVC